MKLLLHVNFKNQTRQHWLLERYFPWRLIRSTCGTRQDTFFQTQQNIRLLFFVYVCCSVQVLFSLLLCGKAVLVQDQQQHLERYTRANDCLVFLTSGSCCASGRVSSERRRPLQMPLSFTSATKRQSPSFLTVLLCFFFRFAKVAVDF